jgi:hypothetical protein
LVIAIDTTGGRFVPKIRDGPDRFRSAATLRRLSLCIRISGVRYEERGPAVSQKAN